MPPLSGASIAALGAAVGGLVLAALGTEIAFRGSSNIVLIVAGGVYGLAPVFVTLGLRQRPPGATLSLIIASLAALLWAGAAVLFATRLSASLLNSVIIAAPVASVLWLIVSSVEAQRAGPRRPLPIVLSIFAGLLIMTSAFTPLFSFVRELIAVTWAIWMFDMHRALGSSVMRTRGAWLLAILGTAALALFVAVQLYVSAFMRGCTISYC